MITVLKHQQALQQLIVDTVSKGSGSFTNISKSVSCACMPEGECGDIEHARGPECTDGGRSQLVMTAAAGHSKAVHLAAVTTRVHGDSWYR